MLIPAALENQITAENAPNIRAKMVTEGANGPTTPDAHEHLHERGVFVIPDILANSGGVTTSYFEWVQDRYGYFWDLGEVNDASRRRCARRSTMCCRRRSVQGRSANRGLYRRHFPRRDRHQDAGDVRLAGHANRDQLLRLAAPALAVISIRYSPGGMLLRLRSI